MNTNCVPVAGTFSKDKRMWGARLPFDYIEAGSGCMVRGDNKKWYVDYVNGLGANLVGYAQHEMTGYINEMLKLGNGFSLASKLEYQVAEKLTTMLSKHVKYWNNEPLQVRWVNTGSDACNAAIRLARAVTGRSMIASYGYHGWADQFIANTPPARGIPDTYKHDIISFNYGEMPGTSAPLAAVILEQPLGEPPIGYYDQLRSWCNTNGCLLIIDEVVTGLRYALGGVSELYGVQPDLMCLGKALSGGHPLAALVGPTTYMSWFSRSDPVFVSGTNAGNVGGLAAADWLLSQFGQENVDYLWYIGKRLLKQMTEAGAPISGDPVRSIFTFESDYQKAYFIWQMAEAGVLMNRPNFPTLAHTTGIVDSTAYTAKHIMDAIKWYREDELKLIIGEENLPMVLFRNR